MLRAHRRRNLSPVFGPMVTLEDRLTPSGAMDAFIGPLPRGAASPESIFVGPRDDRDGVMLYTRTEIMAGLTGDAPLAALAADRALVNYLDVGASRIILSHDGVHLAELKLRPGIDPLAAIAQVRPLDSVRWAEPNAIVQNGPDFTPNDPSYTNAGQYYLPLSQANLAWDTMTGKSEVVIAIADDGVAYNHPDLTDNIWINAAENAGAAGVDDDGNGYIDDIRGWDINTNDADPLPAGSNTHGTHVAGIVAARTNNGVGVAGTAGGDGSALSGARLMPVRWYGTNSWTAAVIADTLEYAADNGAKILNSSYNFDSWAGNATVNTGLNYAYDKNVLLFFSAGNNSQLNPARGVFTQQLFVTSLDNNDVRSSFSNYGDFADVAGNGSNIYNTLTSSNGTGATYGLQSGTSMSTPHAAGVAALIWSQNPSWTRDQVAAHLLATADNIDIQNPTIVNLLGTGRVNAFRGVTETTPAPRLGRTVNIPLNGSAAIAPSSFTIYTPMRFDPASVKAASFELRGDGADNAFNTGDDVLVSLIINNNAAYQMGTNNLVFTKSGGGNFAPDRYRFTAFSGDTKLRDPFTVALDGDSDNAAGGDYVRTFDWVSANVSSISGRGFVDWRGNGTRESIDPNLTAATASVYLDSDNDAVRDNFETTFTAIANAQIPFSGRLFVPLTVSGMSLPTLDIDVRVNIEHPRLSDLDLFVISPNGVRVALATDVGGSGDNFTATRFSDEAGTSITVGSAPFTGTFGPESPMTTLDGPVANGVWMLEVIDDDPSAQGAGAKVVDWSLIVGTAETSVNTDAAGNYSFLNLSAGNYTVRSQGAPAGWSETAPGKSYAVTIPGIGSNVDFGFAQNNTLYGLVVNDANADGTFGGGEAGLASRTVIVDGNGNGVFDGSGLKTQASTNVPLPINDNTTFTSVLNVSGTVGPILDINATVSLTHTYMGEVRLRLIGPGGQIVTLIANRGGSANNMTGTVFDDEAATPIANGVPPFSGSFRPETPLSAFDGLTANGQWLLEVNDNAAGDIGSLTAWSITVNCGEPNALTPANGTFSFALPAGSHNLALVPVTGWRPTNPADGKMSVTAAGAPLTDRNFLVTADSTPPQVVNVQVNDGSPQRSRVTSLRVTFSERMSFPSGAAQAFALTGPFGAVPLAAVVDDTGPATAVTLTFTGNDDFGSLRDGVHSLSFIPSQARDLAQNNLAATPPVNVHRLFGDLDGNLTVDAEDFALIGNLFGQTGPNLIADFNADGTIDGADLGEFGNRFGLSL